MILRHCVCIPTYNNPSTLADVVRTVLKNSPHPILIVDDGSDRPADRILTPLFAAEIESRRIRIQRTSLNHGKGAALQLGIKLALQLGFTHMISFDADSQHCGEDLAPMVEESRRFPWALIIGHRKMDRAEIPNSSKVGRRISNYWVTYQTDLAIADSQSGFRIYPLFHVQDMKFWTKRYDFEIEILLRLIGRGVTVREVPIEVIYQKGEARVSHFHKLWDNVRITALNIILVIYYLLRTQQSPWRVGLAVGLGAWIGTTPLFGLHTLIVAAVCVATRLNFVYMFLGSQVSLPIFVPFLIAASAKIGSAVTGAASTRGFAAFSWNWLLGSLILGAFLGVLCGSLAALYIHLRGVKKSGWTGTTRGGRFGIGFMSWLIKNARREVAYAFLYLIVPYFYIFAPKARRSASQYWQMIRPEDSFFQRQYSILRQLFVFAQILVDRLAQAQSPTLIFESKPHGAKNISAAVDSGRNGLLLVGAHIGGWDLAASFLNQTSAKNDLYVLEFQAEGLTLRKATEHRDLPHVHRLYYNLQSQSILAIRNLLNDGNAVGIMGDRPISNQIELLPFFGKLAPFDTTPYRLAAMTGSPVIFSFGFKSSVPGQYDFFAMPPFHCEKLPSENFQVQVYRWAEQFAQDLEGMVRIFPEQWFNFFPFWSTEPKSIESSRCHLVSELHKPWTTESETPVDPRANVAGELRPS